VLVGVTSAMTGNAAATSCLMSYVITGANTAAALDANAVILAGSAVQRASATSVLSGLTAGSTTFMAQYKTQGTGNLNCTYANRAMMVIPLP
jgi:hypothetical protein